MSQRAIIMLIIGLGGVVWAAWQWAYVPPAANVRAASADTWQLPPSIRLNPRIALKFLQTADRWGNLAKLQAEQAQGEPAWGFNGIMAIGNERYVMLYVQGKPERPLTVGDRLPNGSTILGIGTDSLCILLNGQKRKLPVLQTWGGEPND